MNGRIYDPLIGRFMSADPYIQAPDDLQSHNRYAYVMNNPLNLDDPSGYWSISKAWKKVWKNPIFKALVGIAVAFYAPALLQTWLPSLFGAVGTTSFVTTVTTGALSGFASTGTLKGALTGAFTAGLMFGAGEIGQALKLESGGLGKIALHAGAGCLSGMAGGGSCKAGAIGAALGEAGLNIDTGGSQVLGTIKGAMLGGIGSKLAGGKFSDGATTGAFGYMFNELLHSGPGAMDRSGYQSTNNVESGFHTYEHSSAICSTSSAGCTEQAVFDELRKNPAPARFGTPDRQLGVSTGDTSFAQGVGMVEHTIGNRMVTNTTITGQHILNPGVVFREVLTVGNQVIIRTTGYGMGILPNLNSTQSVTGYVWGTRTDSKIQAKFK